MRSRLPEHSGTEPASTEAQPAEDRAPEGAEVALLDRVAKVAGSEPGATKKLGASRFRPLMPTLPTAKRNGNGEKTPAKPADAEKKAEGGDKKAEGGDKKGEGGDKKASAAELAEAEAEVEKLETGQREAAKKRGEATAKAGDEQAKQIQSESKQQTAAAEPQPKQEPEPPKPKVEAPEAKPLAAEDVAPREEHKVTADAVEEPELDDEPDEEPDLEEDDGELDEPELEERDEPPPAEDGGGDAGGEGAELARFVDGDESAEGGKRKPDPEVAGILKQAATAGLGQAKGQMQQSVGQASKSLTADAKAKGQEVSQKATASASAIGAQSKAAQGRVGASAASAQSTVQGHAASSGAQISSAQSQSSSKAQTDLQQSSQDVTQSGQQSGQQAAQTGSQTSSSITSGSSSASSQASGATPGGGDEVTSDAKGDVKSNVGGKASSDISSQGSEAAGKAQEAATKSGEKISQEGQKGAQAVNQMIGPATSSISQVASQGKSGVQSAASGAHGQISAQASGAKGQIASSSAGAKASVKQQASMAKQQAHGTAKQAGGELKAAANTQLRSIASETSTIVGQVKGAGIEKKDAQSIAAQMQAGIPQSAQSVAPGYSQAAQMAKQAVSQSTQGAHQGIAGAQQGAQSSADGAAQGAQSSSQGAAQGAQATMAQTAQGAQQGTQQVAQQTGEKGKEVSTQAKAKFSEGAQKTGEDGQKQSEKATTEADKGATETQSNVTKGGEMADQKGEEEKSKKPEKEGGILGAIKAFASKLLNWLTEAVSSVVNYIKENWKSLLVTIALVAATIALCALGPAGIAAAIALNAVVSGVQTYMETGSLKAAFISGAIGGASVLIGGGAGGAVMGKLAGKAVSGAATKGLTKMGAGAVAKGVTSKGAAAMAKGSAAKAAVKSGAQKVLGKTGAKVAGKGAKYVGETGVEAGLAGADQASKNAFATKPGYQAQSPWKAAAMGAAMKPVGDTITSLPKGMSKLGGKIGDSKLGQKVGNSKPGQAVKAGAKKAKEKVAAGARRVGDSRPGQAVGKQVNKLRDKVGKVNDKIYDKAGTPQSKRTGPTGRRDPEQGKPEPGQDGKSARNDEKEAVGQGKDRDPDPDPKSDPKPPRNKEEPDAGKPKSEKPAETPNLPVPRSRHTSNRESTLGLPPGTVRNPIDHPEIPRPTQKPDPKVKPGDRDSDTSVIGHYPEYAELSDAIGSRRFDLGDEWGRLVKKHEKKGLAQGLKGKELADYIQKRIWHKNRRYLDQSIERGEKIPLATPLHQVQKNSYFDWELRYLIHRGYRPSPDGTYMVRTHPDKGGFTPPKDPSDIPNPRETGGPDTDKPVEMVTPRGSEPPSSSSTGGGRDGADPEPKAIEGPPERKAIEASPERKAIEGPPERKAIEAAPERKPDAEADTGAKDKQDTSDNPWAGHPEHADEFAAMSPDMQAAMKRAQAGLQQKLKSLKLEDDDFFKGLSPKDTKKMNAALQQAQALKAPLSKKAIELAKAKSADKRDFANQMEYIGARYERIRDSLGGDKVAARKKLEESWDDLERQMDRDLDEASDVSRQSDATGDSDRSTIPGGTQGRTGEDVAAAVQQLDHVDWEMPSTAAYHPYKHPKAIDPDKRSDPVRGYDESAQDTIKNGEVYGQPEQVEPGKWKVTYRRDRGKEGPDWVEAHVYVSADGRATLATYDVVKGE